jgi:undecaprenyl-diphosphatase
MLVLAGSVAVARHDHIPASEQAVFRAVNGLPSWLFWPLWPVMQLGNLVVGTAAGLALALWQWDGYVALAVLAAALLKLAAERLIRRRVARFLVVRQRPGTSEPGARLRGGDVPSAGASFPSGHVILATALACIAAAVTTGPWAWVPFVVVPLVMVGRVYVGAHNPLDVTAGLGAGLLVGGPLAFLLR